MCEDAWYTSHRGYNESPNSPSGAETIFHRVNSSPNSREDVVKILRIIALIVALALPAAVSAADLAVLKAQIERTIPKARGEVGVAIKHLESGAEVLINADAKYPMASA